MALGIIGVLGAVGSASPNNSNHDHRDDKDHSTLTVVGKNPENKVVDLGAQGPSQGDIRVTNAPLYDESGKERIGRFDLFCAITDPADEPSEKAHMAQCTKTFTLPGGEISVQGVEAYPNLSGLAPGWGERHKRRDGQVRWCGGRTTLRTPWKEGHRHLPLHRVVLE